MSICFQAKEVQYLELVFKVRSSWIYFIYRFWCCLFFFVCMLFFFIFTYNEGQGELCHNSLLFASSLYITMKQRLHHAGCMFGVLLKRVSTRKVHEKFNM